MIFQKKRTTCSAAKGGKIGKLDVVNNLSIINQLQKSSKNKWQAPYKDEFHRNYYYYVQNDVDKFTKVWIYLTLSDGCSLFPCYIYWSSPVIWLIAQLCSIMFHYLLLSPSYSLLSPDIIDFSYNSLILKRIEKKCKSI